MRKVLSIALIGVYCVLNSTDVVAQCGTTPIAGDLIISSNTALTGTYNISGLFRVEPGVVCSVTPYTSNGCGELVINAANIEVLGDIIGDGSGFNGGNGGNGATNGSNTAALTGCLDTDNCLVIDVNGGGSGSDGVGPGAGLAGSDGTLGRGTKQDCGIVGDDFGFVPGAGGAGGGAGGSYGGLGSNGGSGGGGAPYNPGNFSDMSITTCTSPVAGSGGSGGSIGAVYGTQTGQDIDLGSGGAGSGGGGKSASNGGFGADGGAGGGLIVLNSSGALTVAGTVSVNGETSSASGGNGGNGDVSTDCCSELCNDCGERTFSSGAGGGAGAGGGSGGGILLQGFGPLSITGTLRSNGGNGTTGGVGGSGDNCNYSGGIFDCGLPTSNSGSTNPGTAGESGGGGSGGRIKVFQNPCQSNTVTASILIDGGNGFGGTAADGTYHLGDLGNITPPTLSASTDSVSCFGLADGQASVTVNGGTAPFTYLWNDPLAQNTSTATGLEAGVYEVTVVDSNQCTITQTVTVGQPDTLTISTFGPIEPDCFGASNGEISSQAFGGTEPYSYLWNDPAAQTTDVATGLDAGTYVVEVTDANGCQDTAIWTLGQPSPFNAAVSVTQGISCFGEADGQATVIASGSGLTYIWDDPLSQTTATASNLVAGVYNVTVSSSQTCDTTLTVTITEPDSLVAIVVENQQVSCNGGVDGIALASQLGGTAPFSYQWDDPSLQTTDAATGLSAGTYNVVITDDNGCTATDSVVVTEAAAISISVVIDDASCNGSSDGQVNATATGGTPGFTYEWNPGAISGNPLTGVPSGTYSVIVTDANNCTEELQNIIVGEPDPIVLSLASQTNISCYGLADGSAEISALGGTPPYSYLWDDPSAQATAEASNLAPGTYSVAVEDVNGCNALWLNVEITQPDSLVASISATTPLTCDYTADGTMEVQAQGGTSPYSYLWSDSNGQTGSTAIDLAEGTYTVTVTDANGCTDTATDSILGPVDPVVADFNLTPDNGLQPLDVTVINLSSGATAYEWIFGDNNAQAAFDTSSFQYLYADSGSFDVTLIAYNDVTGCSDTLTVQGAMYVTPTSELLVPNVITPNGDGLNDIFPIDPTANDFFPFKIRNIYDFKGEVYNRWGEKVYEWTQPLGGWEGRTTSGLLLEAGTYYYVITAKGVDPEQDSSYELKGSITLIK